MLAGLVVGMVAALAGTGTTALPPPVHRASEALAGVLMGSRLDPAALLGAASSVVPLVSVTVVTVVLSAGVAVLLCRRVPIDRTTATLGMVPGGSSAMLAAADDLGADTRLVAIAQYLRVGFIAITAPLSCPSSAPRCRRDPQGPPGRTSPGWLGGADQGTGLLVLCAVVFLGAYGRGVGSRCPRRWCWGPCWRPRS